MVEISWINERIAVSGAITDEDIPYLKSMGLDAIVDVRSEYSDNEELIKKHGLQYLHISVDDKYTPAPEQLEKALNFIKPMLDEGKRVLIHCQNGTGRSPLMAIAVLVSMGMDVADAAILVEDKHPKTCFSDRQQKFIYTELSKG